MSLFWKKRKQQTQNTVKTTETKQVTAEQPVVESKQAIAEQSATNTKNKIDQTVTKQQPKPISVQSQRATLYENWPKHIEKVYPSGQKVIE